MFYAAISTFGGKLRVKGRNLGRQKREGKREDGERRGRGRGVE